MLPDKIHKASCVSW